MFDSIRSEEGRKTSPFYLPAVITKFVEFRAVRPDEVHQIMAARREHILKSDEIEIAPHIGRGQGSIRQFYPNLTEIAPSEYGGVFRVKANEGDFAFKMIYVSHNHAIIQVAPPSAASAPVAVSMLQSFSFLLRP
jgi:hypothetical protein